MAFTHPSGPSGGRTLGGHSDLTKRLIRDGCAPRLVHEDGPLRLLARAEGFVMVRREGALPFVLQASDWDRLPATERAA